MSFFIPGVVKVKDPFKKNTGGGAEEIQNIR